jgi:hypothetical protein
MLRRQSSRHPQHPGQGLALGQPVVRQIIGQIAMSNEILVDFDQDEDIRL